jgi:hypothetical protein
MSQLKRSPRLKAGEHVTNVDTIRGRVKMKRHFQPVTEEEALGK